ncbi:unnamed protein product [Cunninghamella blakesleeana]
MKIVLQFLQKKIHARVKNTLTTLITAQFQSYSVVIQWSSKGQYVIPGNNTIGNQLQLDSKEARYLIMTNYLRSIIMYTSSDEIKNVAVEGNKVTAKSSNSATTFRISNGNFGSPGNIVVLSNEAEEKYWQVNNSTMLVEIAPCLSGNEKQTFLVKSPYY